MNTARRTVTREEACAAARRVLDAARARRDADRAAGRLPLHVEAILRRLERQQRQQQRTTGPSSDEDRAAA